MSGWEGPWLCGPVSQTRWPADGSIHAACKQVGLKKLGKLRKETPHKTPDSECMCGIYAYHDLADAAGSYGNNRVSVIGPGLFWGEIELHTAGFKAEFARPLAICEDFKDYETRFGASKVIRLADEWEQLLEEAVSKYSIPLLPYDMVEDYARTWADPIGIDYAD